MSDAVNHPKHYNHGKIEVLEFLEDQDLTLHRSAAVKYICRAGRKDPTTEIQDLQKAIWYLNRDIELVRSVLEQREPLRPNEMHMEPGAPFIAQSGHFTIPKDVAEKIAEESLIAPDTAMAPHANWSPCPFKIGEKVSARLEPGFPFFPGRVHEVRHTKSHGWRVTVIDEKDGKDYNLPEICVRKEG